MGSRGGDLVVMVIGVGNGYDEPCSNLDEAVCISFHIVFHLGKV